MRIVSCILVVAALSYARAAAPSEPASSPPPTSTETASANTLYTLDYIRGPKWKNGLPLGKQDMDAHYTYVTQLFEQGKLVANGLYGDEMRGFYVWNVADAQALRTIIAEDPAVKNGVLAPAGISQWLVIHEGFGESQPEAILFFILDYAPGPGWAVKRTAEEQDLKSHMAYMDSKLKDKVLLAGGPVLGTKHRRYLIATKTLLEAKMLVSADPAVSQRLLQASIRPWRVAQRHFLAAARSANTKK
jgi:uncharacterized protein YciI